MIENRDALARTPLHAALLDAIAAGIRAAQPDRALRETVTMADGRLQVGGTTERPDDYDRVLVLGGGNVAGEVAAVLEDVLSVPVEGLVVTDAPAETERIAVREGDHPLPTERNVAATEELLEQARGADADTLVLAVVGGGGSALMAAPAASITLDEYRATTEALLESGAPIDAINAVRKHCSRLKGGQLAAALAPATVHALVFSDVVGDDLATIASGPLWPDPTTYDDALDALAEYDCPVPEPVRAHLEAGVRGDRPETPTAEPEHVTTHLVAAADTALDAAASAVREAGYTAHVDPTPVTGEAGERGRDAAATAAKMCADGEPVAPPAVVLAGGETTVTVAGDGSGGPSQEFALGAAIELADSIKARAVVASVDTDGIDGASDVAGAIVDTTTVTDPAAARDALAANDAGCYLAERDALIETGPTGTNVNDLYLVGVVDQ